MAKEPNHVQAHAALLQEGLSGLADDGTPVLWGVTDRVVLGGRPLAVKQAGDVLVESGRVFLFDGDVVFEQRSEADGRRLVPLTQGDRPLGTAPAHLANLFHCAVMGKGGMVTYQPPAKFVAEVLNNAGVRDRLPRIDCYSRRPLFNAAWQLLQPGYHPADRALVHGAPVAPSLWEPPAAERPVDRLPPGLRGLLKDFCFDGPADVANTVAVLLTGVVVNLLVSAGKPIFVIGGNQRGLGKSLLARVIGIVLDGAEPPLVHFTEDQDELAKRLGAKIKPGSRATMLFFDNCRGGLGGSLLESLALAPRVSVRMLGHNEDISHINDLIWVFTANNARATADMTARALLLRLHHDGDPR
jgi:hypothetical protein